jgi:endonuclease/exonuclease/phosphatase family metal-dependent hydrolase
MFADTWKTAGSGSSNTYPAPSATMKIDFWFTDQSGRAKAASSTVMTGTSLSDHYPLAATITFQ